MGKKRAYVLLTLSSMLLITIASCGKKGPLSLEPEKLPLAVENFELYQQGSTIKLTWNFPAYLSDKKSPTDMSMIGKISIYYSPKKIEDRKFRKKSILYKKLKPDELTKKDESYHIKIPFSEKNLDGKTHHFAIQYYYGKKKKSPLSQVEAIASILPVRPIQDLKIVKEKKVLKLTWTRPFLNLANKKIKNIAGYQVYRWHGQSGPKKEIEAFTRFNNDTILKEYFEDMDTGSDGIYSYYVTTMSSDTIESDPSNIASVNMKDIYPPDPPANLAVFKAEDHLYLTWEAVKDSDLSHYIVYRKAAVKDQEEGEFGRIAEQVTNAYYKDSQVKKEITYFYYVTAVDDKGNESARSNVAKEKF